MMIIYEKSGATTKVELSFLMECDIETGIFVKVILKVILIIKTLFTTDNTNSVVINNNYYYCARKLTNGPLLCL